MKDFLGCLIPALLGIIINGTIIYVIAHFIIKYW